MQSGQTELDRIHPSTHIVVDAMAMTTPYGIVPREFGRSSGSVIRPSPTPVATGSLNADRSHTPQFRAVSVRATSFAIDQMPAMSALMKMICVIATAPACNPIAPANLTSPAAIPRNRYSGRSNAMPTIPPMSVWIKPVPKLEKTPIIKAATPLATTKRFGIRHDVQSVHPAIAAVTSIATSLSIVIAISP
jgi:hypothetical protein